MTLEYVQEHGEQEEGKLNNDALTKTRGKTGL